MSAGGTRKVVYASMADAEAEARYISTLLRVAMHAYRCTPGCGLWHTAKGYRRAAS